jgi:hypothetical protein
MKEESVPHDKTPAADLGKFMIAETLCDMVSTSAACVSFVYRLLVHTQEISGVRNAYYKL